MILHWMWQQHQLEIVMVWGMFLGVGSAVSMLVYAFLEVLGDTSVSSWG